VPESKATLSSAIPQLSVLMAALHAVAGTKKLDKGKICKKQFCAWGEERNVEEKNVFLSLVS